MKAQVQASDPWLRELYERIMESKLEHHAADKWPIAGKTIPREATTSSIKADGAIRYAILGKTIVVVSLGSDGFAHVEAYADTSDLARGNVERIRELHPPSEPAENFIEVCYWAWSKEGGKSTQRQVSAERWGAIESNYCGETRERLERMMGDFEPSHGGQLLLWAGAAGTGKTTALRALAYEWRDWCKVSYIMDPEKLFGDASYLNTVILGNEPSWRPPSSMWNLLVLEDAGELLYKDAGEVAGKALMRLLNTVDGMIGQGLRIMILVTTNEKIEEFHEAVARPGRCAQEIRFMPLSGAEAAAWREANDLPPQPKGSSLAELYAELKGFEGARSKQPMGFVS